MRRRTDHSFRAFCAVIDTTKIPKFQIQNAKVESAKYHLVCVIKDTTNNLQCNAHQTLRTKTIN